MTKSLQRAISEPPRLADAPGSAFFTTVTRAQGAGSGAMMGDNTFGDRVSGFPDRELVLEWRPVHEQQESILSPALQALLTGLLLAAVGAVLWFLWKEPLLGMVRSAQLAQKWQALTWHDLGTFLAKLDALAVVQLVLGPVLAVVSLWAQRRLRGSRLFLNGARLRHRSGLPLWLGNLLRQNWELSLDDFRSGRLAFTLSNQAPGFPSIALYFLRWKGAHSTTTELMRQPKLAPASWFLIGQPARERLQKPEGLSWQLNPWNTPEGKAVLQGAFDQLPLVAGLRAQGVPLPPLSSVKPTGLGDGGFDLMAYPRMKAVVWTFFGLLASAALAYHFTRHQHYFDTPPLWAWVAIGAGCALAAWVWMATEPQTPGAPSLKPTQGVLALLPGLAAALLAPSALLALNQALAPAQSISVTVSHAPLRLEPEDARIPAFKPSQALEFWTSLPPKTARQLTVRQGLFGTWQYDSAPLTDEARAFYQQHDGG